MRRFAHSRHWEDGNAQGKGDIGSPSASGALASHPRQIWECCSLEVGSTGVLSFSSMCLTPAATKYILLGNTSSQGNCIQPSDNRRAFQATPHSASQKHFPTAPSRAFSPWGVVTSWEQPEPCWVGMGFVSALKKTSKNTLARSKI